MPSGEPCSRPWPGCRHDHSIGSAAGQIGGHPAKFRLFVTYLISTNKRNISGHPTSCLSTTAEGGPKRKLAKVSTEL